MTLKAWVVLCLFVISVGLGLHQFWRAEVHLAVAKEAVDIARDAVLEMQQAGLIAEAENGAHLVCRKQGKPLGGFQVLYQNGKATNWAALCVNEHKS